MSNLTVFFLGLITLCSAFDVAAAFVLNGTRFIYEEGRKSVLVEVDNQAADLFAGHAWIENDSLVNDELYITASPSVFKVNPGSKQVIRLLNINNDLPKNRETLLWLNVQEIPQKIESDDENTLAVAMNTKVKVIFRPKELIKGRAEAEKLIKIVKNGKKTQLHNGTPYYFAITNIYNNGNKIKLNDAMANAVAKMSPGDSVDLTGLGINNGKITIDAINDWGGIEQYDIN